MTVSCLPPSVRRAAAPLDVISRGLQVPLVQGGWTRHVDLDVAATTPCATGVWERVSEFLPLYSSVHRGAGLLSQAASAAYEDARATVHDFVGAPSDYTTVFTANTTSALNLLARALPRTTRCITFASEHHANLLAWPAERTLRLRIPPSPAAAVRDLETALRTTGRPALVCVTGASNVTGELWPVEDLVAVAHRAGARVVIDAAQLAAHRPIDLDALGADYLALSGHKLYAPFGAGALIGRRDWLDTAPPWLNGGGAVSVVGDREVEWRPAPARHEAGTPNLLGAVALAAACEQLASEGMRSVALHEDALYARLVTGLRGLPGVRLLEMWPGSPRISVASFTVDCVDGPLLAAALSAEHGISVRAGKFCAHPLVEHLLSAGGEVCGASPGDPLRVSLGAFNVLDDVERLLVALRQLIQHGPAGAYRRTDARWAPNPDPRPRLLGEAGR